MRKFNLFFKSLFTFFQAFIKNPTGVGAALPSSQSLARALAAAVPEKGEGLIVELGAGTGVVTRALLDRGISPQRLVIIEISKPMVDFLREEFPNLEIIHGNAADLEGLISNYGRPVDAIVSSLPLRSLPRKMVEVFSEQLDSCLLPGSYFIQFTYSILSYSEGHSAKHLRRVRSNRVWLNFPPARVDVFSHR